MSTAFCLVAYKTVSWMPVALNSFHQHFPDETLIVVDNNRSESADAAREHQYLRERSFCTLIMPEASSDRSHGAGIDSAVLWCRSNQIRYLVHFEPDCLILGRKWYVELKQALKAGNSMAGSHRKSYGPIHPTPSIWDLSFTHSSFRQAVRGNDEAHPRFHELFDLELLLSYCRSTYEPRIVEWFEKFWDTGQRPWFNAAASNKAALIKPSDDFIHFWKGSESTPTPDLHPALSLYGV